MFFLYSGGTTFVFILFYLSVYCIFLHLFYPTVLLTFYTCSFSYHITWLIMKLQCLYIKIDVPTIFWTKKGSDFYSLNFPYIATGPHLGAHFKNIVLIINAQIYKLLSYVGPNVVPLPYNI